MGEYMGILAFWQLPVLCHQKLKMIRCFKPREGTYSNATHEPALTLNIRKVPLSPEKSNRVNFFSRETRTLRLGHDNLKALSSMSKVRADMKSYATQYE